MTCLVQWIYLHYWTWIQNSEYVDSGVIATVVPPCLQIKSSKIPLLDGPMVDRIWCAPYGGPMCHKKKQWGKRDAVPYKMPYMLEKGLEPFHHKYIFLHAGALLIFFSPLPLRQTESTTHLHTCILVNIFYHPVTLDQELAVVQSRLGKNFSLWDFRIAHLFILNSIIYILYIRYN